MNSRLRLSRALEAGITFAIAYTVVTYAGSFGRYVAYAVRSGDVLNDWITHLPGWVTSLVMWLIGR